MSGRPGRARTTASLGRLEAGGSGFPGLWGESFAEPERVVGVAALRDGERAQPVHAGQSEDVGDAFGVGVRSPPRDEGAAGVFGDGGRDAEIGGVLRPDGVVHRCEVAGLGGPPRVQVDDEEGPAAPALGVLDAAPGGGVVRGRVSGGRVQEDEDGALACVCPLACEQVAVLPAVGQDCGAPHLPGFGG